MALDPLTIGSIGSSIIGGLFGRSSARKQAALQRDFAMNGLGWRVQDAQRHGLHPLVGATGQSASYTPVQGAPMGDALADISASLGQEAVARRQSREAAPLNKKNEQLLDAQIAEAQSRTLLNRTNAQRALVGPGAPADPFAIRKENALIQVKLENGETVLIPNPDVYEIGPSELVTGRGIIETGRQVQRERDRREERRNNPHPQSSAPTRTQKRIERRNRNK